MVGNGLRSIVGNPAAPPYRNGPYEWSEHINFAGGIGIPGSAGTAYYVDRNAEGEGTGESWQNAYTTISEAFAKVNADYTNAVSPSGGRNRTIYIAEGYYSEVPVTFSASDCLVVCVAPGGHDSTVFYGSATAGGWDATTTAPAITVTGDNNTFYGLGVVNRSGGLQPAILVDDGALANKFVACKITKDAADSCSYGIEDMGNAYTEIIGCEFTISCKTAGVRLYSDTNNSVQIVVKNCRFYGTPTGVLVDAAAHSAIIEHCIFVDDTSDVADVVDTPILNNSGASLVVMDCYSMKSTANLVTGSGTSEEGANVELA